jgi:hypothetical protein
MKRLLFVFALALLTLPALAQTSAVRKVDLSQAEIDKIVKKFTSNEGLFRQALNIYAFDRSAAISTVGMGGQITGTYRRDSYMTFNTDGSRVEKINFAPISTLTEIEVTASDIDHLGGLDPFAIEPSAVSKYNFTYVGKEKIDDLDLYVFDVAPKVMTEYKKGMQRLFQGRIWVDDRDLQIVKSKGKAVPEGKERFPVVETWRENVDGKYWFPAFSTSDDELVFENGQATKIRLRVKYTNYRVGRTDVKIIEVEDTPESEAQPAPSPTPKKP